MSDAIQILKGANTNQLNDMSRASTAGSQQQHPGRSTRVHFQEPLNEEATRTETALLMSRETHLASANTSANEAKRSSAEASERTAAVAVESSPKQPASSFGQISTAEIVAACRRWFDLYDDDDEDEEVEDVVYLSVPMNLDGDEPPLIK